MVLLIAPHPVLKFNILILKSFKSSPGSTKHLNTNLLSSFQLPKSWIYWLSLHKKFPPTHHLHLNCSRLTQNFKLHPNSTKKFIQRLLKVKNPWLQRTFKCKSSKSNPSASNYPILLNVTQSPVYRQANSFPNPKLAFLRFTKNNSRRR